MIAGDNYSCIKKANKIFLNVFYEERKNEGEKRLPLCEKPLTPFTNCYLPKHKLKILNLG